MTTRGGARPRHPVGLGNSAGLFCLLSVAAPGLTVGSHAGNCRAGLGVQDSPATSFQVGWLGPETHMAVRQALCAGCGPLLLMAAHTWGLVGLSLLREPVLLTKHTKLSLRRSNGREAMVSLHNGEAGGSHCPIRLLLEQ